VSMREKALPSMYDDSRATSNGANRRACGSTQSGATNSREGAKPTIDQIVQVCVAHIYIYIRIRSTVSRGCLAWRWMAANDPERHRSRAGYGVDIACTPAHVKPAI
jgi:hypothetical protein